MESQRIQEAQSPGRKRRSVPAGVTFPPQDPAAGTHGATPGRIVGAPQDVGLNHSLAELAPLRPAPAVAPEKERTASPRWQRGEDSGSAQAEAQQPPGPPPAGRESQPFCAPLFGF